MFSLILLGLLPMNSAGFGPSGTDSSSLEIGDPVPMAETGESDPRTLADLRARIDRIDEAMHRLLIERSSVIDALIKAKGTEKRRAPFRPQREAEMMRRLAVRHEGSLPLTSVEHLWREIITTFTFLQAPFRVFLDLGDDHAAMHDLARFAFGFSVELIVASGPDDVVRRVAAGGNDLGIIPAAASGAWWRDLSAAKGPRIVALLPFIMKQGRIAGAPAFVVAPVLSEPTPADLDIVAARRAGAARLPALAELLAESGGDLLVAVAPAAGEPALRAAGFTDIIPVGGTARGIALDGKASLIREDLLPRSVA
jgi:chorismate mutase